MWSGQNKLFCGTTEGYCSTVAEAVGAVVGREKCLATTRLQAKGYGDVVGDNNGAHSEVVRRYG